MSTPGHHPPAPGVDTSMQPKTVARAPQEPRVSRASLWTSLRSLDMRALPTIQKVYGSAPLLLPNETVLVWQALGQVRFCGELVCRADDRLLLLRADNLAAVEPRLEGVELLLPGETLSALVEHALSPLLTLIERLLGLPLECGEFRRPCSHAELPDGICLDFAVLQTTGLGILRGSLCAEHDVWAQMDFSRAQALASSRHWQVPLRMRMVLAQAQWSAHDIAQWRVGTALRPSGGLRPDPNRLAIQLHIDRSVVFNATVVGEHLVVEDPVNPMEETPESPPPGSSAAHKPNAVAMAPPAPSAEDLLSAIECEVSFELGSMKLTVADIARLRSGQVMRLGVRLADQPVRIVVNGRPVARGELAALGDELVVVITDTRALPHV